jgi:lycopene beta-cyclase
MAGDLKKPVSCDILFAGGGMAALSLLYRAMKEGLWKDQSIIVIDQNEYKPKNWSFWKHTAGPFDQLICKSWTKLSFVANSGQEQELSIKDYAYHTIRSRDFYRHCLAFLAGFENIRFIHEEVTHIQAGETRCLLETPTGAYRSTYLFNSIYLKPELKPGEQYFLQHFKGLMIRSDALALDPARAYLMDFRTGQEHGTSFFYTLPFSRTDVFVEFTIFSKNVLEQKVYDDKLKEYIRDVLQLREYEVLEEEYGVIPMTDHVFRRFQGNMVYIGSAGGDTRGATGYTFTNVQKTVSRILEAWRKRGSPLFRQENIGLKEQLYDATLLKVLDSGTYQGHQIFADLFKGTPAPVVFSFLDAESSIFKDLLLIKSLRPMPFLKAMISVLSRKSK